MFDGPEGNHEILQLSEDLHLQVNDNALSIIDGMPCVIFTNQIVYNGNTSVGIM